MTPDEILKGLYDETMVGNAPAVLELTNTGLEIGMTPEQILFEALIPSRSPSVPRPRTARRRCALATCRFSIIRPLYVTTPLPSATMRFATSRATSMLPLTGVSTSSAPNAFMV